MKKRFRLVQPPIEEFKELLLDKKNWEYVEIEDEEYAYYYYYKYKTDFLIKFIHYNTSDKKEDILILCIILSHITEG
ncbi:hypothetical protein ACSXBP_11345 [Clostridium perfringens]|uniref:hypothetical protein n=1 Tax=Clostridium perfringens TaxID=1502 RepID=UPI00189B74BA|nr:hypothetical protein [Clostridium perfringens]